MNVYAMIPARYASTRLPGKPLLDETGKCLIQHVVEAVRATKLVDRIIVATDDDRIAQAVVAFGGEVAMTSRSCRTGTDRLAEAAEKLELADDDIVINVQGDEPDIPGRCIDALVEMLSSSDAPMATLATALDVSQAQDPSKVKVVLTAAATGTRRALYFSRARIPHDRDGDSDIDYLLHLGVYAYRAGFLGQFARMAPTPAEQAEKLEQLRALENGCSIAVAVVQYDGCGIDTPEDYDAFVARVRGGG